MIGRMVGEIALESESESESSKVSGRAKRVDISTATFLPNPSTSYEGTLGVRWQRVFCSHAEIVLLWHSRVYKILQRRQPCVLRAGL